MEKHDSTCKWQCIVSAFPFLKSSWRTKLVPLDGTMTESNFDNSLASGDSGFRMTLPKTTHTRWRWGSSKGHTNFSKLCTILTMLRPQFLHYPHWRWDSGTPPPNNQQGLTICASLLIVPPPSRKRDSLYRDQQAKTKCPSKTNQDNSNANLTCTWRCNHIQQTDTADCWYTTAQTSVLPGIIIYPWYKDTKSRPICPSKDLPKTNSELKWYLPGVKTPSAKSNFMVWMQIYLATDEKPLLKITKHKDSKMNWSYEQHNTGGTYMKPLSKGDSDCPMYISSWMT